MKVKNFQQSTSVKNLIHKIAEVPINGEFTRNIPSNLRRSFRPCLRDSTGKFRIFISTA